MEENYNRKKKTVERRKTEEKEVTGGLNLHPFFNSEKKATESLKKQGFTEVLLLKGDKNMEENYNRKKATDVHYCKIRTEPFQSRRADSMRDSPLAEADGRTMA